MGSPAIAAVPRFSRRPVSIDAPCWIVKGAGSEFAKRMPKMQLTYSLDHAYPVRAC
jgi:hypothetical protein